MAVPIVVRRMPTCKQAAPNRRASTQRCCRKVQPPEPASAGNAATFQAVCAGQFAGQGGVADRVKKFRVWASLLEIELRLGGGKRSISAAIGFTVFNTDADWGSALIPRCSNPDCSGCVVQIDWIISSLTCGAVPLHSLEFTLCPRNLLIPHVEDF